MPPQNTEHARWFAEEVLPHEPALRGYLRSQFPSVDHDDVVQESFLKLLKVREAGRIAFTKSYLFSIARNTARTVFRRRQFFSDSPVNTTGAPPVFMVECTSVDIVNRHERFNLAVAAIAGLPARCREIMELTVLEGLGSTEIAGRLRLSENTVRVQLARGIKKCAAVLREKGERP